MLRAFWIVVCALGISTVAQARVQDSYSYRYEQVWSATIRLLRVEMGCRITDRDDDIGFLMFDYDHRGQSVPGSVELLRVNEPSGEEIRVVVQIPAMPSYVERMILDRLNRKLLRDFGEPIVRPSARSPAASADESDPAEAGAGQETGSEAMTNESASEASPPRSGVREQTRTDDSM